MRFAVVLLGLAGWAGVQQAQACLRTMLDERAVQWSPVIVKANFVQGGPPAEPAAAGKPVRLDVSRWKVVESYDGPLKPDQEVTVLTFPSTDPAKPTHPCNELPGKGRPAVLLLRPASECTFEHVGAAAGKEKPAYVIVYRLAEEDATPDAIESLKHRVETVRKIESAFSDKDARFQAETLANAVDSTEAEHAEDALIDMGPKCLPAVKEQVEKAGASGRSRLQRVIDELSPPPADTGKKSETKAPTEPQAPTMP